MTNINVNDLPYRDSVVCVVFKNKMFLLVQLINWPENFWKFPQGGINKDEDEKDAVFRELIEELGSDKFKIIAKSSYSHKYDWDEESISLAGFKWRGQNQIFYLVEFLGEDNDIRVNKSEVQRYKWVKKDELNERIDHGHKLFTNYKNTIEKVLLEFKASLG